MRKYKSLLAGSVLTGIVSAQGAWTHLAAPGEAPVTNPLAEMVAFHSGLGQLVLAQVPINGSLALYGWDGATWSTLPNGALTFWNAAALAFDPVRQKLVLASRPASSGAGQVREWTPGGWVWRTNHTLPIEDLCWYPPTQSVVTWNTTGIWQWDGSTWTAIPGTAHPRAQWLGLAFDPGRSVLVGCTNYGSTNGVTLEWDGAAMSSKTGTPILNSIEYSPELSTVIGVNASVNATWQWNPTTKRWHAFTSSPGFLGPYSGEVQLDVDQATQHTLCRRRSQTGLFWFDPNATPVHATLVVDGGSPGSFLTLEHAMQAAGPGDRIKLLTQSLGFWSAFYKPVHLEVAPGLLLPSFLPIDLTPGDRATLTGGTIGTVQVVAPSAEITFRDVVCRNIVLADGALRCEDVTVLGGTHDYSPDFAFSIACNPGTTLTLDDCTVTGTSGFLSSASGLPTGVPPSSAIQGPVTATIVNCTLTGGAPGVYATGAAAISGSGPTLVTGGSTLTTTSAPAFTGPVQVTSDVTWNGSPLPGALPALAYITPPATVTLGQTLTIDTTVPSGEVLAVAIGARIAPITLPGSLLPLQLDPSSAVVAGVLAAPGGAVPIAIPNQPALEGLETWWQGVSLSGNGVQPTNLRSVKLL